MAGPAGQQLASSQQPDKSKSHVWLIMGPAGSGKSTVASSIAKALHLPYLEGDEFHPSDNIAKMSAGVPLNDEDRWDWLTRLRDECLQYVAKPDCQGVVLTCSALKSKYRDVIRTVNYYNRETQLHFIYLHAPEEVLVDRLNHRQGHYMGPGMLHSQLSAFEVPRAEEIDVVTVDVSKSFALVQMEILGHISKILGVGAI